MMLILASRSAARNAMLHAAGVPFEAQKAPADEEALKAESHVQNLPARELALYLAEAKACSLVQNHPDALILGCDQTLELEGGAKLDKAKDTAALADQLRQLSGKMHQLHSAAVIIEKGIVVWQEVETARLTMRALSDGFIKEYLKQNGADVLGCVGGYQIEGQGVQLFEQIEGSHFAVLGLPLIPLLGFLRTRGVLAS